MWDTHTRTVRNHYANHDQPTPHTNTHARARALVACGIGKVGHKVCGGHSTGETPSNIPNLEAKPGNANGTAIDRSWESRTPPQHNHTKTTRPPPPLPARRPGWGAPAYPHTPTRAPTPHAHQSTQHQRAHHTPTRTRAQRTHTTRTPIRAHTQSTSARGRRSSTTIDSLKHTTNTPPPSLFFSDSSHQPTRNPPKQRKETPKQHKNQKQGGTGTHKNKGTTHHGTTNTGTQQPQPW